MRFIIKHLQLIVIGALAIILFFVLYNDTGNEYLAVDTGVDAVKYLYNFDSVKQLDSHMENLKKITTESVFEQLTIDNTNRTLNTYLKFKGEPTKVIIHEATDTHVLYSLDTKYVDSDRVFAFVFNLNENGKIEYVREMECIDFVTDID